LYFSCAQLITNQVLTILAAQEMPAALQNEKQKPHIKCPCCRMVTPINLQAPFNTFVVNQGAMCVHSSRLEHQAQNELMNVFFEAQDFISTQMQHAIAERSLLEQWLICLVSLRQAVQLRVNQHVHYTCVFPQCGETFTTFARKTLHEFHCSRGPQLQVRIVLFFSLSYQICLFQAIYFFHVFFFSVSLLPNGN